MSEPTEARTIDAIQTDIECAAFGKAAAAARVRAAQGGTYNERLRAVVAAETATAILVVFFCELRRAFKKADTDMTEMMKP